MKVRLVIILPSLSLPAQPVAEKLLYKRGETRSVVSVGRMLDGLSLSGIGMDHL